MTTDYVVQPLDVLMIRGNKTFGGAGERVASVVPPWPSLCVGAFCSVPRGKDAAQPVRVASGEKLPGALGDVPGTLAEPGSFAITWLSPASAPSPSGRAGSEGFAHAVPLPADFFTGKLAAWVEGRL